VFVGTFADVFVADWTLFGYYFFLNATSVAMSTDHNNTLTDVEADVCAICLEEYVPTTDRNDPHARRPSASCAHSICFECAIQYAVANANTTCPSCRCHGAYTPDPFIALLEEDRQAPATAAISPLLREKLETAVEKAVEKLRSEVAAIVRREFLRAIAEAIGEATTQDDASDADIHLFTVLYSLDPIELETEEGATEDLDAE
jgi:hypothetical protein